MIDSVQVALHSGVQSYRAWGQHRRKEDHSVREDGDAAREQVSLLRAKRPPPDPNREVTTGSERTTAKGEQTTTGKEHSGTAGSFRVECGRGEQATVLACSRPFYTLCEPGGAPCSGTGVPRTQREPPPT